MAQNSTIDDTYDALSELTCNVVSAVTVLRILSAAAPEKNESTDYMNAIADSLWESCACLRSVVKDLCEEASDGSGR